MFRPWRLSRVSGETAPLELRHPVQASLVQLAPFQDGLPHFRLVWSDD